jgi:hypothetical protein
MMPSVQLQAHFDGRAIQLDEPYPLAVNSRLLVTVLEPEEDNALQAQLSPSLDAHQRLSAILKVSRRCAAAPELDPRGADEIIGYDVNGLPG